MTTPAMMKYYAEIMNPKPKKQKKNKNEEESIENQEHLEPADTFNIGGGLLPTPTTTTTTNKNQQQQPNKKVVKRPWEVRHEKMEKSYNPELQQNGLPTSFISKGKRKNRD